MRVIGITTQAMFILCLPILLLTASIGWAVNSSWLYEYGFDKYSISQDTGLAQSELEKAATELIGYFNSGEETINIAVTKDDKSFELFNERETAHLRDVKGLIWLDYRVLLGTLVYVLGYAVIKSFLRKYKRLAWGLFTGSGLTLGLILVLGVGMLFNFEQLFWQFHLISFTNDLWLLDPTRDYLIMLFPSGFWFDSALFCVLATAGMAIVLNVAGGGFIRYSAKRGL